LLGLAVVITWLGHQPLSNAAGYAVIIMQYTVTIICTLRTCRPHLPSSFIMQVACVEYVDNEINKSFLRMRWLIMRYQHTLIHLCLSF